MIQEPSNSKRYLLTVEVDVDALVAAYTGGDTSIQLYDLPATDELILFECEGWLPTSGIHVVEIEEIQENKTSISIDWSVEDIQGIVCNEYEKSISDDDALVVLEYLEENYSPTHGITWQTINDAIDELSRDNSITLY